MTPTVLVVDDEVPIVLLLGELLHAEGYRVLTAHNGEDALALARAHLPNLVLADVMMPRLDGVELCRHLHADPRTRGIPVILMSAVVTPHARATSAVAFVSKPFDLDHLLALIHRHARPPALRWE
ncbi:MAG TPA: response regulator [Chloroflexota bacterium]|jgi:CheY-like chemotaxis protein|nr:response regulator [Chloroflexota bacterium]